LSYPADGEVETNKVKTYLADVFKHNEMLKTLKLTMLQLWRRNDYAVQNCDKLV